ncbi:AAA family ATPase [Pseudofrankia sp. DC12]|uniref:ATP-binding protein n=1 Tax=Pseudofrankia sp. DC12 TaxID=683315 RepID=UPI000A0654A3|nr:AAA family ATPase [Pseudofrankia sp. DC12]
MVDEPVILLQGPRAVGKSTLLRELAAAVGAEVIDLDDLAVRDAVGRDPGLFVGGDRPTFIDEYQRAPIVLEAIKAELNRDSRPGRFVLTGSARHESLPTVAQALTGRLHRLPVYPLSQGEIGQVHERLLDNLFADATSVVRAGAPSSATRADYISRVVAGGFPLALARGSATARNRWFDKSDLHEGRSEVMATLPNSR